jgi:hypothetical protein
MESTTWPEITTDWEVIFLPYRTTPEAFEKMADAVTDVVFGGQHPFPWRWGTIGVGSNYDRQLSLTWSENTGPAPTSPVIARSGAVHGTRDSSIEDFQRECVQLMAELGYEGWSVANKVVSSTRYEASTHEEEQELSKQ